MKTNLFSLFKIVATILLGFVSIGTWGQISESFETGLPTAYTTTTSYTLGSGTWTGQSNGVIRGTTGVKTGSYSLQLRSQTGAQITTPNITSTVGTVTFWGSASAAGSVQVNYSIDGGVTWIPATGSPFTVTTGLPVQKTAIINSSSSNILVQFYRTAATVYIDDINIDTYSTNTISTSSISGSPFCVTAATGTSASVPFTSVGTFNVGNVYTAQLSNASGSFASPVNIGTLASTSNSGTISASIPANTATGTGYRIRVVSNNPSVIGTDNGSNLTINLAKNAIAPTATQTIEPGVNGTLLTVTDQSAAVSHEWKYSATSGSGYVSFVTPQTGTTYTPNFAATGIYYVICESTFACGTAISNEVQISVNYAVPTNGTALLACIANNQITLNWTAATGATLPTGYIVFAQPNSTIPQMTAATAGNAASYTASSDYSLATTYSTLGKAVYKGIGTTATITGLTNLSQYTFKVVAYRGETGTGWSNSINNTNVASTYIKTFTIDVPEISGLAATVSSNSSSVSWNVVPGSAGCYEYLVVANQGAVTFTPSGDGSGYTVNPVYAGSNQVVYKGAGNSVSVTGLTEGLQYCYKVFVREVNSSQWSDGISVCQITGLNYCASTGASNNSGILNVELNTINNTTLSTPGYSDFTGISTSLERGSEYPLNVNVNTNGNYTSYVKAWIDWNRNGTFDATEAYELGTITNSANGSPSLSPFTITVPLTAVVGNVRMRVSANSDNTINNYSTPCQSFTYGEIEDYTITVVQPPGAEINVKGGGQNIPNGFDEPYGLNNTLFAATPLNTDSIEKEFFIENIGLSSLNLTGTPIVQITGSNPSDFIVTQQPTAASVASGNSLNFKIKFRPLVAGIRTAVVSISNNDVTGSENPYTFAIKGTGNCVAAVSGNFAPTSGPALTEVIITSASNLTGAIVIFNDEVIVPLSISSSSITIKLPSTAQDGDIKIQLANGCIISQYFDVITSINNGCASSGSATVPGNLYISQVTDSGTDAMSYIEIFNGTGSAVNLNGYKLRIFNNGNTGTATGTINLNSVSLANNDTYVVVIGISSPTPVCTSVLGGNGSLADQTANGLAGINFNYNSNPATGHDFVGLYNGSTLVDSWGVYGNQSWASSLNLGGSGASFERKGNVTAPSTIFNLSDWNISDWGDTCDSQDYSGIGSYIPGERLLPVIDIQPSFTDTCATDFIASVTAEQGTAALPGLAYQWYELAPDTNTWVEIIGATSGTLTINISDKINYQYYVQVRENTATCYTASQAFKIKDPETKWSGSSWSRGTPQNFSKVVIEGNYDTSINGALNICELTVNSGSFVIKNDFPVTVQNNVINNAGVANFIVESDGNLNQLNESLVNTTPISVRRLHTLTGLRKEYNYLSSPVADQNMKLIFGNNAAYVPFVTKLNEATNYFVNATAADYLIKAKGFGVKEPTTAYTGVPAASLASDEAEYKGIPNNGNGISLPLAWTSGRGYNLAGNPYPSNIDIIDLYNNSTTSVIDPTFRFWDNVVNEIYVQMGGAYQGYSYALFNALTGPDGFGIKAPGDGSSTASSKIPTRIIKVSQAFMIRATGAGAQLNFNNAMRKTTNAGTVFYGKTSTQNCYRLQLVKSDGFTVQNGVAYFNAGSQDFGREDTRIPNSQASDALFSYAGDAKVVINGRSTFTTEDVVSLGLRHFAAGTYTIQAVDEEGVFANGQTIYLKDKQLGILTDLTAGDYIFTSESGEFTNRFEIVYKEGLVLAADNTNKGKIEVFRDASDFVVRSSDKSIERVELYDASGRLVLTMNGNAKEIRFNSSKLVEGMYILKAELKDGEQLTKKIRK